MSEQNTAVEKKGTQALTVRQLIEGDAFKAQIAKALPKHLTPDRFIRVAITALTKTPKLTQCTQASLFNCLLNCSQLGIEPDGRRAHLIPYGDQCQLIIDYKGICELVMRSGIVSNVHADVICENDVFEHDRGAITVHKIDFRKPRGAVYAVYSICRFKDGTEKAEVMTREEVEAIRKRSKAGAAGPWVTDWNEMAKKTVFRRLSKWLPLSAEYRDALEVDDDKIPDGQWMPPIEADKPVPRMFKQSDESKQDEQPKQTEQQAEPAQAHLVEPVENKVENFISEPKIKRLYATAKNQNVSIDDVRGYIAEKFETKHFHEILTKDYDIVIQWIENGGQESITE
ncbi:MAG: recombinase RecT [Patescibacteria group bacterium]